MRMRRSLRYFVLGLAGALLLGFCHGVPASAQSDATPALSEDELARVTAALGLLQSGRTDDTFLESVRALSPLTQGEVMFEAAGRGYDEAVTGMIDAGVPVNARGIAGWTPLMAAIFAGNDDLAITLIDRGADPNATAPDGISVASLAEAASSRSLLWKLALARGDTSDGSLLGIAARTGDLAALNEAVGAGADVNAVDEKGRTPLLNAAQGGYYEAVSYLIDRSANVNKAAPDGATPLAIAVLAKNEDLVRQFLVAKADPNAKLSGIPVISVALSLGSDIIAKALLDAGADPAAKDDNGLVPLDYAKFGELETMDPRIEAAALRPRFGQADLLNAIAQRDVVAVRKILDSGVSANTRFPDGKTPIHVALIAEDTSIIRTLLLHNPDLSERTPDGETVLMLAARGKAALIILPMISQELTSSGDPRLITLFQAQDRNGRTAILNAVMNRKINGAHVLPDLYPAVGPSDTVLQTLDNHGLTPLAVAVLNNDADAVQQLLRMGAKLHVTVGGATLQEVARAKRPSRNLRNGWMVGQRCDSKRLSKPVWTASCGPRPPGASIAGNICVTEAT